MTISYKILDNNTVEIFYDNADEPSLSQPTYPNGDAFVNKADATNWALLYIASIENETAPFAPSKPGELGEQKPTEEEIAYGLQLLRGEI
jgi:hypothetical protein